MPAITDPYSVHFPNTGVIESGHQDVSLRTRLRVAMHRPELTRALAEGADPGFSQELGLRASRLIGERNRSSAARTLRRTIDEAHRPPLGRHKALIRRGDVLDAEDAIRALIDRLGGPKPVRVEGMAMIEMILTNADNSPLYNSSPKGTLRDEIAAVTEAMGSHTSQSHEFPVGA
jgi:hypothetical protein